MKRKLFIDKKEIAYAEYTPYEQTGSACVTPGSLRIIFKGGGEFTIKEEDEDFNSIVAGLFAEEVPSQTREEMPVRSEHLIRKSLFEFYDFLNKRHGDDKDTLSYDFRVDFNAAYEICIKRLISLLDNQSDARCP
jgi:hypothetical protein